MASTKDLLIMMNQADSEGRGPVDRCKRCNKLTKEVLWQHGAKYLKDEWRDGEEKWTPPIDENDAWQRKFRYQRQQGEEAWSWQGQEASSWHERRHTSWQGEEAERRHKSWQGEEASSWHERRHTSWQGEEAERRHTSWQGEEASSWHGQGNTWQKSKTRQETSWPQWPGKAMYQNSRWW